MPSSRAGLRCDGPSGGCRTAPRLVFRSGERVVRLFFAAARAEAARHLRETDQIILGGLGNASKIFRRVFAAAVSRAWTLLSSRAAVASRSGRLQVRPTTPRSLA